MGNGERSTSSKTNNTVEDKSSKLPPNVEIISWPDGGPAFIYSDLNTQQKKHLIEVFLQVSEALDIEWPKIRLLGLVDEHVELIDPERPTRDNPRLHPSFVQESASEDVVGDTILVAPGLAFRGMFRQGNWISVDEDTLVDCENLESEDLPEI